MEREFMGLKKSKLERERWLEFESRRLSFPGADSGDVLYLRTVADSDRLRSAFSPGTRVVIAGAGWIGLETAAAARAAGCPVTVLEPQPGALHDQLGPELGAVFAGLHR